jgi:hypothetical protein
VRHACGFGQTVIRIFTPSGTLVVEAADPALKVTVEGDGGLTITGAGLEEIRLRPGSYKVHADKDGQRVPLERELVSIAKNGREVVKVKLETGDRRLKPTTGAFTPLFNGKDLTGWTSMQGSVDAWRVEDGALTCSGPTNYLRSIRDDFGDFHLRAVVKINAGGNSGIYFRTGNQLVEVGDYEAQITNKSGQQEKTGSLYNLARVGESPVPPNTWFTLEIIAVGKQIRVLVNGTETANYTETRAGRKTKGHIALQHLDSETSVFFRKIEIKQLPPAKSTAEGTFVLLGGKGIAERKFDTLDDAVLGASDGDTIEIRGNGPWFVRPIPALKRNLHVRAAKGFQPVIKLRRGEGEEDLPLFRYEALLSLEGLEFQSEAPPKTAPGGAYLRGTQPLYVANCKFLLPGYFCNWSLDGSRKCYLTNCEFHGCEAIAGNTPPGAEWVVDNCVQGGANWLGGWRQRQASDDKFRDPVDLTPLELNDLLDQAEDRDLRPARTRKLAQRLAHEYRSAGHRWMDRVR